jgi:hypothetical protein
VTEILVSLKSWWLDGNDQADFGGAWHSVAHSPRRNISSRLSHAPPTRIFLRHGRESSPRAAMQHITGRITSQMQMGRCR